MAGDNQERLDPLDSLESQIEELERRIFGNGDYSESSIIGSLVKSNTTVNSAISSHNSINLLFDRLDQVGKFLDPSFEELLVDVACKLKVVLESENELRLYVTQTKKLCDLNKTLSGEPFKKVPTLVKKLRNASHKTIKTHEDCDKLKKDIEEISENYTNAVKMLTRTFLLFDTLLSEIEESNKEIEPLDLPIEE